MESDRHALIDQIYEAALIPELWVSVIERLSAETGCAGGVLFSVVDYRTRWLASEVLRAPMVELTEPHWMGINIRAQRLAVTDYMGFVTERDLCSEEEIRSAPLFTEFLRPRGFGPGTATKIPAANGDLFILSLERREADGPVPRSAVDLLDGLRPHIARSALLAGSLWLERMRGSVAGLDALAIPAAVIGPQGRLLLANACFEALGGQIVMRAFDRVAMVDADAEALWRDALASIGSEAQPVPRSIPVRGTPQREPFVLHLIPIRRQANDLFNGASALLVVVPLARRLDAIPGPEPLRPHARAAELVEGRSVRDIAVRHTVGQNTVRCHIKQVLAKTGTLRQADLVAKLAVFGAIAPAAAT